MPTEEDAQFTFDVGEVIVETDDFDKLDDTTICEIKQRFVDVDSEKWYYKVEVLNVWRYIEHYWLAGRVESDYEPKETWSSEEINEWENEDWGSCPAFSVDHRPERQAAMEGVGSDGN